MLDVDDKRDWLDVEDAAKRMNLTVEQVRQLAHAGDLRARYHEDGEILQVEPAIVTRHGPRR